MLESLRSNLDSKVRVAVSECLLGSKVRWDGSDYAEALNDALKVDWLELVGVCPEVGVGMGVPREPIRLVATETGIRALEVTDGTDWTSPLRTYHQTIATLLHSVSGYIFTERSPSCGLKDVKLYRDQSDEFERVGTGIHAAKVVEMYPDLPVAEASDLLVSDAAARAFLHAVRCYHSRKL